MNRELLDRLGSPYALSLRVWIWSTPVVIFGTAFTFGSSIFFSHTTLVLLMGLATHLLVGLVSLFAILTYLKKSRWDQPRPALVLITYAGMGLGRGLIISTTALLTEIPASPDFFGRAISSMWVFFFWATVLTLVFESSERFKGALADVDLKFDEIASIQARRERELMSVRADFLGQVTRTLSPALDRVRDAIDLERLANTLIEPESFATLQAQLQSSTALRKEAAKLRPRVLIQQALKLKFPAISIATLATSALAFPLIYQGGLPGFAQVLLVWLSLYLAIRLLSHPRRLSSVIHLAAVALILIGDAFLAVFLDSQFDLGDVSLLSLTAGMWLVAFFLIFLNSLDHQRRAMAERMTELVNQLVVVESKLQQELALERMELTQLVHSEVQGRLRAAAVLAKTTGRPGDLQRLKEECIEALTSGRRSQNMEEFLEELSMMWTPGLSLKIEIDLAARSALDRDPYLRKAFQAVLREGIINAVKHGDAKGISVQASAASPDALMLTVTNDGKAPRGSRRGLGSQLLDDLTTSWSVSRERSITRLNAHFPVVLI